MLDKEQQIEKVRKALGNETQPVFVAINSRVNGEFLTLISLALNQPIKNVTRQRKQIAGNEILESRNSDVGKLVLERGGIGFTTIDALFSFALTCEFVPPAKINAVLEIIPLGSGKCTIEVACNPIRLDLIQEFRKNGRNGLRNAISQDNTTLTTDTPELAKFYFPEASLYKLNGKIESLTDKSQSPLLVGIVDTGKSLEEEGWLRLSEIGDYSHQAILLRSQTCLIKRRL